MPRLTSALAMGTGTSGAMEVQTSYADLEVGVKRTWGRTSEFDDAEPGEFTFTLDNSDGRFTPDNASSSLTTKVTEGMQVCWQLGDRLVAGGIRSIAPAFPGQESAWSQVVMTADDMLGAAARRRLGALSLEIALAAGCQVIPFDDPEGTIVPRAIGFQGNPVNPIYSGALYAPASITFGERGFEPGLSVARFDAAAGVATALGADPIESSGTPIASRSSGIWITPLTDTGYLEVHNYYTEPYKFGVQDDQFMFWEASTSTWLPVMRFIVGETYLVAMQGQNMLIDGVTVATDNAPYPSPADWSTRIIVGDAAFGESSFLLSNWMSLDDAGVFWAFSPERVKPTTTAERLELLADILVGDVVLDSVPSGLSGALLAVQDAKSKSVLDALNELILTEQGHIYTTTTGTLTSPVQKIKVRERDRPASADYTFALEDDLQGAPEFVRDLTNMVSSVDVDGPTESVTVADSTLTDRVGSANATEEVLLSKSVDLQAWGEDRLVRGANVKLKVASLVINAMTTATDRQDDLLAMIAGDRIEVTGLPSTQLGFTTWEGWLLGAEEWHTLEEHSFTLYLAPVLPPVGRFDTAVFDTDIFAF